jgi:uncharacterized membrane protein
VIAGAYLLHPALHGINMYEFHSLSLVVPLLFWVAYLLERQRIVGYWLVLALILATREDMALLACCIGVYAAVAAKRPLTGLSTIAIALLYVFAVKYFVMPDPGVFMSGKGGSYSYAEFYAGMIPEKGGGAIDLLLTLVTNPIYSLRVALAEGKLLFFLQIMVPVVFSSRRPRQARPAALRAWPSASWHRGSTSTPSTISTARRCFPSSSRCCHLPSSISRNPGSPAASASRGGACEQR